MEIKVPFPKGVVTPVIRKMIDGELTEVRRYDTFRNTFTNQFMTIPLITQGDYRIFALNGATRFMFLGTGTAPYTPETTEMGNPDQNFVGGLESNIQYLIEYLDNGDNTYEVRFKTAFAFGLGDAVGTYTEYAVSNTQFINGSTVLTCGGLFKDTQGDPVAITVGSDEQLIVNYEFSFPISQAEYDVYSSGTGNDIVYAADEPPQTVNINGTDHTITVERARSRGYRLSDPTATNNYFSLISAALNGGYLTHARVYDDTGAYYQITNSSIGGHVNSTGEISPAGDSISRTYEVVVTPAAGMNNIESISFANYNAVSGTLVATFDPPVPVPAGDKFVLNYNTTTTWS